VVATNIVDWLQAGGTVGAVVVALGIAWWAGVRERRQRPALSLEFDPELRPPDFMAGMRSDEGRIESHWVRLRVENRSGRRSADDVEVLFVRLEGKEQPQGVRTLDVVPLGWSSTQDEGGRALTRITIPPGLSRHVDLLAIEGSELGSEIATRPVAAIQVSPVPTDDRHLLPGGSYTFHLAVAARDTDAAYFKLDVEVPSERLSEATIRENLAVSSPVKDHPQYG
jgi:hypothetical protein